ncbi:hypothetical protein ABPG74_020927 [Tetrahymena malaccensis]
MSIKMLNSNSDIIQNLVIVVERLYKDQPFANYQIKKKCLDRLIDTLFSYILSKSMRLKISNARLDRESLTPYLNNMKGINLQLNILHTNITEITFKMRQNNQFNKALALEVLIQSLIEKGGDFKCFENYDTKKVKRISMITIISFIRLMADVYVENSRSDCEYDTFDNNKFCIANKLISKLLAERNINQSNKDQVVSLNNLKVFKIANSIQQNNCVIQKNEKENEVYSLQSKLNVSQKPCVQSLTPICRKIKGIYLTTPKDKQTTEKIIKSQCSNDVDSMDKEEDDDEEQEEQEEEEIDDENIFADKKDKQKNHKQNIQIGEFQIENSNKIKNNGAQEQIQMRNDESESIQTVHNSEVYTPIKDFFNLRKGLIIPSQTEYSSQMNTGLQTTDRQFTNYCDLSCQIEKEIFDSSLDTLTKKEQTGFPKNVFELNKNTDDNIQSFMGAFQRKQEEPQNMPFQISLNIPSINSNFGLNSNFNPMSSFAQINSKPQNKINSNQSQIGISNFFSINNNLFQSPQNPVPTNQIRAADTSLNQTNQNVSMVQNSIIHRQNPLSLSQLNNNESQLSVKNSFFNPSTAFQKSQNQNQDLISNKFVLNPVQAQNVSMNQTILSENITLYHQKNKDNLPEQILDENVSGNFNNNILGQNFLSSRGSNNLVSQFLKDKSERSQQRKIVFQQGFQYDNKDFDQFLKHENEIVSSSLWEDYDIRKSKIQNKNLQISQTAIFTKQSCEELTQQSNKHYSNLLTTEPEVVSEDFILHSVISMLQGIHSDLFQLNQQNYEFYLKRLNITLPHITHESLLIYLEQYVGTATKIIRLQAILNYFKNAHNEQLEQREVFDLIGECLQCLDSQLLDLRMNNCSILELPLQLRQSFREVDLMYFLIFSNYQQNTQFNFDLKIAISSLPTNTDLLNIIYNKLEKESISQVDQEILFTFFSHILQPLISNLTQFVITGKSNEVIYKNLPVFLRESFPRIQEVSQNLSLLKTCDLEHFNACCQFDQEQKGDLCQIQISQDIFEIRQIEKQFNQLIQSRRDAIEKLLQQIKYKKEVKKAQELEQRLNYVKTIKENFLRKVEMIQKQKKEQHELKLKKAQEELNQLEIKRIQAKYKKLFEQQEEKAIVLENQLKENERIKQEQLEIIKNKIEQDFSSLSNQEKKAVEQQLYPGNKEIFETENELKILYEKAQQLKENQMVEEVDITPKHQAEINLQKMYEEKTKLLEEEQRQGEEEQKEQTEFLKSIYEQKQQELTQSLVNFKKQSPQKLNKNGFESSDEDSIINDEEILANQIKMFSSYKQKPAANKMSEEIQLEEEGHQQNEQAKHKDNQQKMEIEDLAILHENEVSQKGDKSPSQGLQDYQKYPNTPISVIVQACIMNIIKSQAQITNEAIMNIIFEKYNIMNIFSFLKKYMFCERGDKIDDFLEVIVKENCQIELISLYEASSLFDEEDFLEPLNQYQPYIEFKKEEAPFYAYNFLATNLQDLIKLKMKNCPQIIEVLFNEETLAGYVGIFSHLIKFRYANKVLQQKWKQINRNIITWNSNKMETSHTKKQLARLSQSLRHKIQNFIGNFQNYLYFDIIENAWKMLNKALKKCKNFQELQLIHTNYLKYIQQKTFMKTPNQIIEQYLNEILQIQIQFVNILENIISYQEEFDYNEEGDQYIQKINQLNHKFQNYEDFLSKLIDRIRDKETLQTQKLIHFS